jgi:general secretion pathway protein H
VKWKELGSDPSKTRNFDACAPKAAAKFPSLRWRRGLAARLSCRAASGRAASVAGQRGFTLIEILLVVGLMAILSAVIVSGSGMLTGTRMRSAGALIMSSVRMAMTRANSIGRPVRIVFDLNAGRLMMEETRGRMLRVSDHEEGAKAGAQAATEAEQQAAEYARDIVQGPRAPAAMFSPVASFASDSDDPALGRELGKDIRFIQVQTEHDTEPRTEGRAYLYFWPGGGTERASIQITRPGDHTGLTVLVNALTGRAKLERGRVELEEARQDVDFQEREEP